MMMTLDLQNLASNMLHQDLGCIAMEQLMIQSSKTLELAALGCALLFCEAPATVCWQLYACMSNGQHGGMNAEHIPPTPALACRHSNAMVPSRHLSQQ